MALDLRMRKLSNGLEGSFHFDSLEGTLFSTGLRQKRQTSHDSLDVVFNLIRVGSGIEDDILYADTCEELEGVFNQRSIRQRQQTLRDMSVVP